MYPQFFWADRCIHRIHEGATMIGIVWIFHFVPPDAPKIRSLARSVLRFFVKLFPSYLSLPYQNTPREWFLRNLYSQINKFYDYKLLRDLNWKDGADITVGITRRTVNYLRHLMNGSRLIKNSDLGIITAILNPVVIFRRWCKLNFGL